MIKAILFDIGNTLVITPPETPSPGGFFEKITGIPKAQLNQAFMTTYLENPDRAVEILQISTGYKLKPAHVEQVYDYWESQKEMAKIDPDIVRLIKRLSGKYKIGLVSNIWTPFWRGFKKHNYNLIPYIRTSILSFQVGMIKPATRLYELAAYMLEVNPQECVMVGDDLTNDIVPSMSLGMTGVWYLSRPAAQRQDMVGMMENRNIIPDTIISNLLELEEILNEYHTLTTIQSA